MTDPFLRGVFAPALIALTLAALPAAAGADCYAEYKAKQDDPLRLHYGILRLSGPCPDRAEDVLRGRLAGTGWTLLDVVALSPDEPDDDRKADAGEFYLRY